MTDSQSPGRKGRYGSYGGRYVPETLFPALEELEESFERIAKSAEFLSEFHDLLRNYGGRPTPLYHSKRLSEAWGVTVYFKREDLLHTGAHKLNNCLGQALLAKKLGKRRIISETGAGQHGVASATVSALLDLECVVYMGEVDTQRQRPNVLRMNLLGAEVRPVTSGSKTLKDATNEAIRDWVAEVESTHYIIGSTVGPHPYPEMVGYFQSIIGKEAREQILERAGSLPTACVACVGGGSNALGLFRGFVGDQDVALIGVEAGGRGEALGDNAATLSQSGRPGVLHGAYSYLIQDDAGQVIETHSVSAGLDYPGVGPEHSHFKDTGRATYISVTDNEALDAFRELAEKDGILPALETAHAIAGAKKIASEMSPDDSILICLSGRGDKDLETIGKIFKGKLHS